MKLRRIELSNFRCFERLPVELAPDVTVLVGNNGTGKTAILDGIAYALSLILTRFPGIKGKNLRADDIRIIRERIQAPFVRVEAESTEGVHWTRTLKRDSTAQTAAEVPAESNGEKSLFEHLDPAINAVAKGENATLPVFVCYGVSRAILDIPERRRGFRKEFRRFDALDNALDPATRFKDLFEWFYAQERDEMERIMRVLDSMPKPGEKQWEAETVILKMRQAVLPVLGAVRDAVKSVIPGFSTPRIKTNPLRMVLTQRQADGSEKELSLQMLSDGYRTMLALVMDFARRMAQANPQMEKPLEAEAILMVDEIDLHLHPIWQQTVIPSFRRAFPNTQLILTTHSPQVLTTVESGNILIVDDGTVRHCPAPTFGARSSDVVAEVLGLQSLRPPGNEIASKISFLFAAIDEKNIEKARLLREELEQWAKGFPEPDLVRADVLLRRLEYQQRQSREAVQR